MPNPRKGRRQQEKLTRAGEPEFVCRCDCGGKVMGVRQFGRLFSWCTKCSQVIRVKLP